MSTDIRTTESVLCGTRRVAFEPDNENSDIVACMTRLGLIEELFTGFLSIFDATDEIDSILVRHYIPKLLERHHHQLVDTCVEREEVLTPSQANIKNSSSSQSSVSVV